MFVGKPEGWWQEHGHLLAERFASVADQDCRGLVACVLELQRNDFWKSHYDSWPELCLQVFDRPAEWVEQVVEGVRVLHLREPEVAQRPIAGGAALAAQQSAQAALALEGTFAESGGQTNESDNVRLKDVGSGNSAAYLAARLKKAGRDDLLAQIGPDKEYRSVRAAAIEAGIVKDVPVVRLADPEKAAASILERMGEEWAAQLTSHLTTLLTG